MYGYKCSHTWRQMWVRLQRSLNMHHTVVVNDRTEGRNRSRMLLGGESNGRDGEDGPILISRHFIFEYFKTHLQMLRIHNIEESFTWLGSAIERVLDFHNSPRDRGSNGTIGQLVLQLMQLGPCFIITTTDTCHVLDFLWCFIKTFMLIALPHQNSLILEFCFLQLGTAMSNLFTQGDIAESCYDLTFLDILARILYAEHNYLLCDTAIDRHLADSHYLTLDSC